MSVDFDKVLVANRGEISIRIVRALRELGIGSVAVYSEADRDGRFVRFADEAFCIGPGPAAESYLKIDAILDVAVRCGAQAIHPGFGFLAENATFARACTEAGLVFVGPPADAIEAMGSKIAARQLMEAAGVPIVPGVTDPVESVSDAVGVAEAIGYPVAVKASAGGGGKGFRVALTAADLRDAFEGASRESEKFFADGTVYLERYLPNPRHVEIQILADAHGNTIWLGERDCSIQRRHQKLVEESPSPVVSPHLRERMGAASVRAAEAVGYRSAGTLEYLVSGEEFFFLEMNTRIQVEHTVTEMVTGVDLVREQIRIAAGHPMSITQAQVQPRGHAFEVRVNAEDASKRFLPSPAPITTYVEPSGPGVRVDSGVEAGSPVPDIYDPMIAKLIVWDVDRESARRRMIRALDEYVIEGPVTLIGFHRWLFEQEEFIAGGACHELLARMSAEPTSFPDRSRTVTRSGLGGKEPEANIERRFVAEVDGRRLDILLRYPESEATGGNGTRPTPKAKRERTGSGSGAATGDDVVSPMQGTIFKVMVEAGQTVAAGDVVCIVEAMKMENEVTAHKPGIVVSVPALAGASVQAGERLVSITSA